MMPGLFVDAARRLADVLERENDALEAMDLRRAADLVAEKIAALDGLTAAGQASSGGVEVSVQARRLMELTRGNRRLLERAIEVQQRVIGIVAGAMAAAGTVEPAYRPTGHGPRVTGPMALSTQA